MAPFNPETVHILVLHIPRAGARGKIDGFEPIVTQNPVKKHPFLKAEKFRPLPQSVQIEGAPFSRRTGEGGETFQPAERVLLYRIFGHYRLKTVNFSTRSRARMVQYQNSYRFRVIQGHHSPLSCQLVAR